MFLKRSNANTDSGAVIEENHGLRLWRDGGTVSRAEINIGD